MNIYTYIDTCTSTNINDSFLVPCKGLKKLRTNQSFQYPELSQVTPSEIVVGGSLGHETTVPGKFDVDMVILSRGWFVNQKEGSRS